MSVKVEVVDYSEEWPRRFRLLSDSLSGILDGVPCKITHVGSTAVKGLAAKPIIDIDIILGNFADFTKAKNALEAAGYRYKGNLGLEGREMFVLTSSDYPHNLYVCDPSSLALKNHLVFRNYLRCHPECVKKYGKLKKALAEKYPDNLDAYCEEKSGFISGILSRCDFDLQEVASIRQANIAENDDSPR